MYLQQAQLLKITLDPVDIVFTPEYVARDMVEFFQPKGKILEPCKGEGVFLRFLPKNTEWCEINEGKDFFEWTKLMDWIIGNPPYAEFAKWIYHSMSLATNVVFLIPCAKPFYSQKLFNVMKDWGSIKHMRIYGSGSKLKFPIGFAIGAVHFQRNYHGPMYFSYYEGKHGD